MKTVKEVGRKTARLSRRRSLMALAALALSLASCGEDPVEAEWEVAVYGKLGVGPLIDPPKTGWIWAAVAPSTVEFHTLACEPHPTPPQLAPVEFYTSTTSPSFGQYQLKELTPNYPRLRTCVALRIGVPGNPGDGPWLRGTRYGESAIIDLSPCPADANYPKTWAGCYTGIAQADVVIDQAFEGCD